MAMLVKPTLRMFGKDGDCDLQNIQESLQSQFLGVPSFTFIFLG